MDIHTGNGACRRSGVHPHRSNTQGSDWVCRPVSRPVRQAGTRMRHNRGLALTVAIHRASSGCHDGYPRPVRQNRPATRAPSPLKTTALRVIRRAGYPHGQESAGRQRVRPGRRRRPAFRAGRGSSVGRALMLTVAALRVIGNAGYPHGRESAEQQREPGRATAPAFRARSSSSAGRALMLTVEMHSAASRFGCRISTREPALSSLTCSRASRMYTTLQVMLAWAWAWAWAAE